MKIYVLVNTITKETQVCMNYGVFSTPEKIQEAIDYYGSSVSSDDGTEDPGSFTIEEFVLDAKLTFLKKDT